MESIDFIHIFCAELHDQIISKSVLDSEYEHSVNLEGYDRISHYDYDLHPELETRSSAIASISSKKCEEEKEKEVWVFDKKVG